jgi:hypothetical protein
MCNFIQAVLDGFPWEIGRGQFILYLLESLWEWRSIDSRFDKGEGEVADIEPTQGGINGKYFD